MHRRMRATGAVARVVVVLSLALLCQGGPRAVYTGVWNRAVANSSSGSGTKASVFVSVSANRKTRQLLTATAVQNDYSAGFNERTRRGISANKPCLAHWKAGADGPEMCPQSLPVCAGVNTAASRGKCVDGLGKKCELSYNPYRAFEGKKVCSEARPLCKGFQKGKPKSAVVEWGRCGVAKGAANQTQTKRQAGRQAKAAKVKEQQAERRAKHVAAKAARDERLLQNDVNAKGGTAGKAGKGGMGRFKYIERGGIARAKDTNKAAGDPGTTPALPSQARGGEGAAARGASNGAAGSVPSAAGQGQGQGQGQDKGQGQASSKNTKRNADGGGKGAGGTIDPHGKGVAHALSWLVPLVIASFTWGISEVFCDACIDDGEFDPSSIKKEDLALTLRNLWASVVCGGDSSVYSADPGGGGSALMASRGGKLSGEQGTAVAGVVMVPCALFLHFSMPDTESVYAHEQSVTILATIAGITQGLAALTLYKAYETAPSTLIVPLTQLTAIMTLFVSLVVASLAPRYPELLGALAGSFITGKDMVAYVIILVGGLYPVAKGNVGEMMKREFWAQPFVVLVLLNDLFLAATYEIIAICTSSTGGMSPDMYVVITSYSNIVIYIGIFLVLPTFRNEMLLLGDAGVYYTLLAMGSELCNWLAAWAVTYAYRAHYNSGVVNAAEVSLNQVANLVIAVGMQFLCRFGRHSAVTDVKTKAASCCIVAAGLVLTTLD